MNYRFTDLLEEINKAMLYRIKLRIKYRDSYNQITVREILPKCWASPDKFTAFCFLRNSERTFRLSNIVEFHPKYNGATDSAAGLESATKHNDVETSGTSLATTPLEISTEHDEKARLRKRLNLLHQKLADWELKLALLKGELLAFERNYIQRVGIYIAELDKLETLIAEVYLQLHPNDPEAQENFEFAKENASSSDYPENDANINGDVPKTYQPTISIKKVYHKVARQIHPDLATDPIEKEIRNEWMREANQAFEEGDEAALQNILLDCEKFISDSRNIYEFERSRLIKTIAQISSRIEIIKHEILNLKKSQLFLLMIKVQEAAINGVDLLNKMAEEIKINIADRNGTYENLLSQLEKLNPNYSQY